MSDGQPPVDGNASWLVEAGIALLEGSRRLAQGSLVLAGVSAFALVATELPRVPQRFAASAALALGVVAAYLALRTVMDLMFFRAFRSHAGSLDATLASFDAALRVLRWIPDVKAGRGINDRVAGIRRVVRMQGIVLLAQAVLIACVPWL